MMECPKCGYAMSAFDVDCPRCTRVDAKAVVPVSTQPSRSELHTPTATITVVAHETERYKAVDEIFCPSCGRRVKREAVVCVGCGVPVDGRPKYNVLIAQTPRNKTTAILLCFFFGFFGWLYTYEVDKIKFWANLGGFIITSGIWGIAAWLWAFIESLVRPEDYYLEYPNG